MKPQRIVILVFALLALLFLGWRVVVPPSQAGERLTGYIEGETLYLASPVAGTVARMDVRRGQRVAAGAPLFAVEPAQQAAEGEAASAELAAALAQAEDARKGQRAPELGIIQAELTAAEGEARETGIMLNRTTELVRRGIYARVRLDEARAEPQTATARVEAARQRLAAAQLGARPDQLRTAEARVAQARARLVGTGARIDDMAPRAPAGGRIEEVFYQRGEWAAANQAVVALIPDDRVLVRFFVPERQVAAYRAGRQVRFGCDGCPGDLTATISYVSPRPEFTPPVIYSREARDRLVFMVEARPDGGGGRLVPGLPVDVVPIGAAP